MFLTITNTTSVTHSCCWLLTPEGCEGCMFLWRQKRLVQTGQQLVWCSRGEVPVRHNLPNGPCWRKPWLSRLQKTLRGPLSHPGWAQLASGGSAEFYCRLFGPGLHSCPFPFREAGRERTQLHITETKTTHHAHNQPAGSSLLSQLLLSSCIKQ